MTTPQSSPTAERLTEIAETAEFSDRSLAAALARRTAEGTLGDAGARMAQMIAELYTGDPAPGAVQVAVVGEILAVTTPYRLKDVCKQIPGARWSPAHRAWTYPASATSASNLVEGFEGHAIVGDAGFAEMLGESDRRGDAQAFKHATDLEPIPHLNTTPWLHQLQAFHFLREMPAGLAAMSMGHQPAHAKVLTPGGWREFGSLRVGDEVIGSDGTPIEVLEVKPWVDKEICRVHLRDGAVVECSPEHLWQVRGAGEWCIASTSLIQRRLEDGRKHVRLDRLPVIQSSKRFGRSTRRIRRIERTGTVVPQRCIRVAAEDGLYVTNDYVLTHNTGKTLVATALMSDGAAAKDGNYRALILCPKAVIGVWPREFAIHSALDWQVVPLTKGSVAKRTEEAQRAYESHHERVAIVVNYEAARASAFNAWSTKVDWDHLVADECHRIKAAQGQASRYAAKVARRATRRLGLTGTPMPQGPLDVFGQYRMLDPSIFGKSFTAMRARFAIMGGYEGREVIGYQREDEFNAKFYSIAFRVEAEDVLDLPGEVDVQRPCTLTPKARRVYDEIANEMYVETDDGEVTADNVLVKILRLQQITGGAMTTDDDEIVEVDDGKESLLSDILSDLPAEEPVVVFCRFHHDLDVTERVAAKLKRSYGEVSGRRNDMGADAKMPEGIDVMGVQLQAGSIGIDLTRAHVGIYYSLGHSLSDYLQSRARLHRPGQDHKVLFMHLIAEDTIDEDVYVALAAKEEVVNYVLKGIEGGFSK